NRAAAAVKAASDAAIDVKAWGMGAMRYCRARKHFPPKELKLGGTDDRPPGQRGDSGATSRSRMFTYRLLLCGTQPSLENWGDSNACSESDSREEKNLRHHRGAAAGRSHRPIGLGRGVLAIRPARGSGPQAGSRCAAKNCGNGPNA